MGPDGRYSRQELFFPNGAADQARLRAASVVLIGCGALGTVIASHLARAGVGRLRIVDRDFVDETNLQRQTLFDEADVRAGLPKAVAAADKLRRANSEVQVEAVVEDFSPDNAERLLAGVDLAMDASDNFEARYLLNDAAVKLSLPWVYSAAVAGYGVTMNVRPGLTPCLSCVFPTPAPPGSIATCDTAGVIGPVCGVVGSLAAAEALKLLVGAEDRLRVGLLWVDVWNNSFQQTPLTARQPDCPTCGRGELRYLQADSATRVAVLCGRDAVQVRPAGAPRVRLEELAERLRGVGQVSVNEYLLRFRSGGLELTLFPDARAIVKGTSDPAVARGFYAKYVGS